MTTLSCPRPNIASSPHSLASAPEITRMYAIVFEMRVESLRNFYGNPSNNAYTEICNILVEHGFTRRHGSTYFGGETINAVTCVLAAIDLAKRLPWFASSVRNIRMLRIEEMNDLMPAVQGAAE